MPHRRLALSSAVLALCLTLGPGPLDAVVPAQAEGSSEARTPAEVYERKSTIHECIEFVAKDLKTRFDADPEGGTALMLLVVDPTTSLEAEIGELRSGLQKAWDTGPLGLKIGVLGVGTGEYTTPSRIPRGADGALASLAFLPIDGPKNIQAAVRDAARRIGREKGGPRAIVLVSEEGGEGEDDVEKTRDALFDAGAAFYAIAGESAFERSWIQTFEPREALIDAGLTERYHPQPRKRVKGQMYFGGETAFGLVPYKWEHDLAQSVYFWVRPPNYPVPSGFGYWPLATLAYSTGGRYFVFDFAAAVLKKRQNKKRKSMYEFSRIAMLAPDLRPRKMVLKDLKKDWRARTILKVWEFLADEKAPMIQVLGTLEARGGMRMRPTRPVRSASAPPTWFEKMDQVENARDHAQGRIDRVEQALKWWRSANGKERTARPGKDPLLERAEADFQLLGVQLLKVRFQWYEALAALQSIRALDVTYRRARILPQGLLRGLRRKGKPVDLASPERNARYAEVVLAATRLANKFAGTPWALSMQKGNLKTFRKDVRVIEEPEERPERPDRKDKGKKKPVPPPPMPTAPPKKPVPGPRPGSSSGGPTTGGR